MTLNGQWAHFSPAHWFRTICTIPHNLLIFPRIFLFQRNFSEQRHNPRLFRRTLPPRNPHRNFLSLPHDHVHAPTPRAEKILIKTKKIRDRNEQQWSGSVGAGRTTDGSPARRPGGKTDAQTAASTVVAPSDGHYKNILKNCFLCFFF